MGNDHWSNSKTEKESSVEGGEEDHLLYEAENMAIYSPSAR